MKEIQLTKGQVAEVDDRDFEWLNRWKWQAQQTRQGTFYAVRCSGTVYMHRVIMEQTDPKIKVDHEDENGLNNQRRNLRLATQAQNLCNRGPNRNNTSGHKGVTWDKINNKWKAQIVVNRTHINLGRFDDVLEAAAAYNEAAVQHHGEFANTGSSA
jgi:hypothetical protein